MKKDIYKKIPKYLFGVFVTAFFICAVILGYFVSEFYLKRSPENAKIVIFTIEQGDSVYKIASELEKSGVLSDTLSFKVYVWLFGLQSNFQPGEYTFNEGERISRLVTEMTKINIKEKNFTIIEGWNLRDLANYLKNKNLIENEEELNYFTGRPAVDYREERVDFAGGFRYDFLSDKPAYVSLEGYIYPDTYRLLEEDGVEKLLEKALKNFGKKLTPELRKEIERQGKSVYEVLTIASIIEREVNTYEDRRIVSDIIRRRIEYGMPLQMDSTVNYVTASGRSRSTYADLETDSFWNTYKYKGLPLGPINNPSVWAIKAVLYPQPNDYLFFLTDKEGNVYYAKTGAEHTANRKYLD